MDDVMNKLKTAAIQAVPIQDLVHRPLYGWRVIKVVTEQVGEEVNFTRPHPDNPSWTGVAATEVIQSTRAYVLLRQSKDDVVEKLRQERDAADQASAADFIEAETARKDLSKALDAKAEAEKSAAELRESCEVARTERRAAEKRARRMEEDLGKLRRELGEERWKALLGE